MYSSTLSLTSVLGGGGWSKPSPGRFTHCTGEGVGPRPGLDGCEKFCPPPGFDPRTVQSVVSQYADYDIPRYCFNKTELILNLGTLSHTLFDKYNSEASHG